MIILYVVFVPNKGKMGQSESAEVVEECGHPQHKLHKLVRSELTHITKFDAAQLQELYSMFLQEVCKKIVLGGLKFS